MGAAFGNLGLPSGDVAVFIMGIFSPQFIRTSGNSGEPELSRWTKATKSFHPLTDWCRGNDARAGERAVCNGLL